MTFRDHSSLQEHLASVSSTEGFDINGVGGSEIDLELSSLNSPSNIQESASNESLSSASATITSETAVSSGVLQILVNMT